MLALPGVLHAVLAAVLLVGVLVLGYRYTGISVPDVGYVSVAVSMLWDGWIAVPSISGSE